MTENQYKINNRTVETVELERIEGHHYAEIVRIDRENGFIWIDYPGNPLNRELPAEITDNNISVQSILNKPLLPKLVKIEFYNGNPTFPLIREIYYAAAEEKTESESSTEIVKTVEEEEKTIRIKATRIILEADEEVIIKSGNAKTIYRAEDGKIVEEADDIESEAKLNYRLKGGSVLIN